MNQFEFDKGDFEVEINVSTNPEKEKLVSAKMRRSNLDEEIAREKKATIEYREVSSAEEEIVVLEEAANAELFNKVVLEVRGFRLKDEPVDKAQEWRDAQPLLSLIPSSFKNTFVRGSRICSARFVEDEDDGVILGGNALLPVELIIGYEEDPLYVIKFELPEPEEKERIEFADKAMQFRTSRGKKKSARVVTDLNACVKFFDELMKRGGTVEGGTVQGKPYSEFKEGTSKAIFLESIHPIYKHRVINAALSKYNAKLQD
jgi:hypothetical protein